MRSFVGIDFDREFKAAIEQIQQKLRKYTLKGRWKHVDNFHLTLKFLDEINMSQQEQINKIMENICADKSPFRLSVAELGIFPAKDCIRVLWLGLGGSLDDLGRLQSDVDTGLGRIGFEKDTRSYKPHITIGQDLVFGYDFEAIRHMVDINIFPVVNVEKLHLFKSEQVGNKRIYTRVADYKLG